MAQSGPQLDGQVLHNLRQRFPEIPEGVVSQCMLQNNNNLAACCRALTQESGKYLYGEYHGPEDGRVSRNRLLHINLGIHPAGGYPSVDGAQLNGGRTLVHGSGEGHVEPPGPGPGKQLICLVQEPRSAPALGAAAAAAAPGYNPFFTNEQNRKAAATPPPQPAAAAPQPGLPGPSPPPAPPPPPPPPYAHAPRYGTNPITVTVSQNVAAGQGGARAVQIRPPIPSSLYGAPGSIYIRQASQGSPARQGPQAGPWQPSPPGPLPHYGPRPLPPLYPHPAGFQPPQYPPKQPPLAQSAYRSPPSSQCPSPFGSPQHQGQPAALGHQGAHVFVPPGPGPAAPAPPYQPPPPPPPPPPAGYQKQGAHSVSYVPYAVAGLGKGSMKKIEITVEPSGRAGAGANRSPSPSGAQPAPRTPHPLYGAAPSPAGSPSRAAAGPPKPPFGPSPVYITYTPQPPGPAPLPRAPPNPTAVFKITVGRAAPENLLNLVDQEERSAAPEPIQPISVGPRPGGEPGAHRYQRTCSSGSDDYAYTQALLLHQRARMERLAKQLKLEKEELERLKAEVNGMEHHLMQRRLRRVSCTTAIPTPEEMTRLRSVNRQLQINVDCTLKEVDLLQSRGNFDPKAINNFYDHIEPGPVVPPKPAKKDASDAPCVVERKARRISVTSRAQGDSHEPQAGAAATAAPDDHPATSRQAASRQTPQAQARDEDLEGAPWNCDSCTFLNHPALNRCEQCEMPRST
ncbi:TGF-beta-activated kinase 1 and MAP3K7-binding protein 3 [Ornithorhynchus anatinus]|nr:TGF-beta-activated kinase 1 and MAP3K7-binding protein 3 [Ornithorhynchus anatinus]XP_028935670.1 TGF-beta-activated kinase 1 and MAP3K7-binding protein 3 [Ornithorhynchus anatinus]